MMESFRSVTMRRFDKSLYALAITHDLVDYWLARVTVDQRELAVCHGISKVYFRPCDSTSAESGVVASPDKRREILMTTMGMCQ